MRSTLITIFETRILLALFTDKNISAVHILRIISIKKLRQQGTHSSKTSLNTKPKKHPS